MYKNGWSNLWGWPGGYPGDVDFLLNLGKVAEKKIRKKFSDLLNPPRTPPGLVFFTNKKFTQFFFVENCIYNGRNEFYTWSHFKNK